MEMGMEIFFGWFILAIVVGVIANSKGRSGFGWFLISILLSPLIGGILVLALPKAGDAGAPKDASGEPITSKTHIRCPECREVVRKDARKCRHCGTALIPVPRD
jgi:hypothetical protein